MIALFTSNENGGIVQFTIELAKNLKDNGNDVVCFIPENATINVSDKYRIVFYEKIKTIFWKDSKVVSLCERIMSEEPSLLWCCDSTVLSAQITLYLKDKIKQVITFHDAGTTHPSWNNGIRANMKQLYVEYLHKKCLRVVTNVLLLSPESKKTFLTIYPSYENKVKELLLGAHIPEVEAQMPKELSCEIESDYFLFFGRIDKYKGIDKILAAYDEIEKPNAKFIVAGKGNLSEQEKNYCDKNRNVILINRFIDDSEMIWLIKHCLATCLPYIEATQSGVIPISYKLGKPVITSNVRGLTQFVEDNRTGIICHNHQQYVQALLTFMDKERCEEMGNRAKEYYFEKLDWSNGLSRFLKDIDYE